MSISSSGYSGSVNEAQWAALNSSSQPAHVENGFDVTAPAGSRTVNIAAGTATGHGVRVTSDAIISNTFPAPTAGQWYLIAIRRTWGAGAASAVVFLPGPSTDNNAASKSQPPYSLPTGFTSTPGVQADQPLAWVWVTSLGTAVVTFPVAVTKTGAGYRVPTLWALGVHTQLGTFTEGALVAVLAHGLTGGGALRTSFWAYRENAFRPQGMLRVSSDTGITSLTTMLNSIGQSGVWSLQPIDSTLMSETDASTYTWNNAAWVRSPRRFSGATTVRSGFPVVPDRTRYFDTTLNVELEYINGAWRVANPRDTMTDAQRIALPTGLLVTGYEVTISDNGWTFRWFGTSWILWNMNSWMLSPMNTGTGWTTLTTPNTLTADGTDGGFIIRSGNCYIAARATRASGQATVTADSSGNISPDLANVVNLANLTSPAGASVSVRPPTGRYGTFRKPGTALGSARINANGTVDFTDIYPTQTIAAGDIVQVEIQWSV